MSSRYRAAPRGNPHVVTLGVLLALGFTAGCNHRSNHHTPGGGPTTGDVFSSVEAQVGDRILTAAFQAGSPPAGGLQGPTLSISGPPVVVTGTTTSVNVSADRSFDALSVFVGGLEGVFRVVLPDSVTQLTLRISLAQALPANLQGGFDCVYAAESGGAFGPRATEPTQIILVPSGELQVSLTWNVDSDTDLHVVEPSGEEIYYGNDESQMGGKLDIDSNAGCSIDGVRAESISWDNAPSGHYVVRVDLWDSCEREPTEYVVTINNRGSVSTFTGTLEGTGDHGGEGDGELVAEFDLGFGL